MTYDLSRKLFKIGTTVFTCGDFLKALDFFGVLDQWKNSVAEGIFYSKQAAEKSLSFDSSEIQSQSSEFRYNNNLLSVDEFSLWLTSRELNEQDYESFFLRKYWSACLGEDVETQFDLDVSDRDLFSELYFSGAFENLLISWQKRLLAWKDSRNEEFPELSELEENFKTYNDGIKDDLNWLAWLDLKKSDLSSYTLECYEYENETELNQLKNSENLDLEVEKMGLNSFRVQEFHMNLPEEISEALKFPQGELVGPVIFNDRKLIIKIEEHLEPQEDDQEVLDLIFGEFSSEVWKTLKVKYVS